MLGEVEVVDPEELLGLADPALSRRHRLVLGVVLVIVLDLRGVLGLTKRAQLRLGLDTIHRLGKASERVVGISRLLGLARDYEGGASLVDEDVVHLIDDREVVGAL